MIQKILGFFNGAKVRESMQTDITYDPLQASINRVLKDLGLDDVQITREEAMQIWHENQRIEAEKHAIQASDFYRYAQVTKKLKPRKVTAQKRSRKSRHLRGFLTDVKDWESLKVLLSNDSEDDDPDFRPRLSLPVRPLSRDDKPIHIGGPGL